MLIRHGYRIGDFPAMESWDRWESNGIYSSTILRLAGGARSCQPDRSTSILLLTLSQEVQWGLHVHRSWYRPGQSMWQIHWLRKPFIMHGKNLTHVRHPPSPYLGMNHYTIGDHANSEYAQRTVIYGLIFELSYSRISTGGRVPPLFVCT